MRVVKQPTLALSLALSRPSYLNTKTNKHPIPMCSLCLGGDFESRIADSLFAAKRSGAPNAEKRD